MSQIYRQHPLSIVHAFWKYIFLLIFPLLRSLVLVRQSFVYWLSGVWFDLLFLFAIVLFGFFQWYFTTFKIQEKGLYFRKGVFFRAEQYIPYANLSSVGVDKPFYLRPFHIVRLKLETDAGKKNRPDVKMLLHRDLAEEIVSLSTVYLTDTGTVTKSYKPRAAYIAILSLITSNTITGVLFVSTFITQTGKILGQSAEDLLVYYMTRLTQILAYRLPPAAAILACIILGGWLIGFLINLVNHLNFYTARKGGCLYARAGVLVQREYHMAVDEINCLTLRQSFLTKILGFYSAMISCTGYGKDKNELAALLPAVDSQGLRQSLHLILPEIQPTARQYKPPTRTITRFLIPPCTTLLCTLAGFLLLHHFFPEFHELILYLGIMVHIPIFWWLFVKIVAFFHVGIGIRGDVYTFRSTFAYAIYTTVVHKNKIARVEVRQSLFQKMAHCSDVIIYTYNERKHRLVVQNVDQDGVEGFLKSLAM